MSLLLAAAVAVTPSPARGQTTPANPLAQSPIPLPDVAPFVLEHGKKLSPGPVKENSGIVRSRTRPDLFWMHNDSGDEPRIYPVHRDGSVYSAERYGPELPGVLIAGAINVDWEDITVDNQNQVIVADSGNNDNDRRDLVLYIIPEPSPTAGRSTWLRRVFFRYPDQDKIPAPKETFNFDCEAIFTLGDRLYILSKHRSDTQTTLYRFHPDQWREGEVDTLDLVDRFELHGQATAADATANGKRLLVCTYGALWLFDVDDPDQPLRGDVSWLPFRGAEDVEAACFADDKTILVGSEVAGELYEVPIERFTVVRARDHQD